MYDSMFVLDVASRDPTKKFKTTSARIVSIQSLLIAQSKAQYAKRIKKV